MPSKASYGYSGQGAYQKDKKVKLAMVAGAAAAGAAVGVGSYYAYNRYQDYKTRSWCNHRGEFTECDACRAQHGSTQCREEPSCFSDVGCSFELPDSINRDDLMTTGFLPEYFTPPIKFTITKLEGAGFTPADLGCDEATLNAAAEEGALSTTGMSFKPNFFITLTSMDALDDAPEEAVLADFALGCRPSLLTVLLVALFGRWVWGHRGH